METPPTPPLFDAALHGDNATIRRLLAEGVPPDTPCTEGSLKGQTPLMAAIFSNHTDSAQLLLEAGAKVTNRVAEEHAHDSAIAIDGHGDTAPMLQLLLAYGYNPNAKNNEGEPLLSTYAWGDHCHACLRLLLEHGADANASDEWQNTPIMHAGHGGAAQNLRLLQAHGADINAQNASGRSVLMQILFPHGGAEDRHMLTDTQAELCFYERITNAPRDTEELLPRLRLLLNCGADCNLRDHSGWNALLYSLGIGNSEAARLLLAHGANLHGLTPTALHRTRCCMELHGYADALLLLDRQLHTLPVPLLTELATLPPIPTRKRNFFIRRDQCTSTAYICFKRGGEHHRAPREDEGDSPCISDDDIFTSGLCNILEAIIPQYTIYDDYNLTRKQWETLCTRAQQLGGKPAHAISEVQEWVTNCFNTGRTLRILGV